MRTQIADQQKQIDKLKIELCALKEKQVIFAVRHEANSLSQDLRYLEEEILGPKKLRNSPHPYSPSGMTDES